MKIRADVAELLRAGLSDRAIVRQLHVGKSTVAQARAALRLPKHDGGYEAAPSLEAAFRARIEPVEGGHARWTGHVLPQGLKALRWRGRRYTAHQAAFIVRTGQHPVGRALAACDYQGCVEPAHVDDALMRRRNRAVFEAIFGNAPTPHSQTDEEHR